MVLAEQLQHCGWQHGVSFRKRTPESEHMGSNPDTALNCYVTSGKELTLSASVSLSVKWGSQKYLPHRPVLRIKWIDLCGALKECLAHDIALLAFVK